MDSSSCDANRKLRNCECLQMKTDDKNDESGDGQGGDRNQKRSSGDMGASGTCMGSLP